MTDSSKETQQTQSSTTNPYAPAVPLVNSLISQYGALNPGVTANQGGALTNLSNAVSNVPNFGGQAAAGLNNLFSSNNAPQVGMLQSAYDTMRTNLTPTASGANLNPYDTPGFGDALKTMINDTTNQVKGVYSGSGRDPSGAGSFAQSLGRGITSGISPTIAGQYNTNFGNMMNANNSLLSGAGSTASSINNLRQSDFGNVLAGMQGASGLSQLYSSPAMAQLGAANAGYGQQYQNLAQLLQPTTALAGLGNTTNSQGTSTQTQNGSLMSSIMGGITGGVGALGTTGAFGSAGWLAPLMMMSDIRTKKDIAKVGKLNDGQNVYSFKYKGSDVPQIGLMAQEVERVRPEAVREVGGLKMVNYDLATRGARVGALRKAA